MISLSLYPQSSVDDEVEVRGRDEGVVPNTGDQFVATGMDDEDPP